MQRGEGAGRAVEHQPHGLADVLDGFAQIHVGTDEQDAVAGHGALPDHLQRRLPTGVNLHGREPLEQVDSPWKFDHDYFACAVFHLVDNKANKTHKDKEGKTAFEHAVFAGNEEIINLLK